MEISQKLQNMRKPIQPTVGNDPFRFGRFNNKLLLIRVSLVRAPLTSRGTVLAVMNSAHIGEVSEMGEMSLSEVPLMFPGWNLFGGTSLFQPGFAVDVTSARLFNPFVSSLL
jgi:hypothetical protein